MNTIFYRLYGNFDSWIKNKNNCPSDVLDLQIWKIKTKNKNIFRKNKFLLNEKYIYFLGRDLKVKCYLNLNFVGIYYSKEELHLRLFNEKKFFDLYFDEIKTFKFWKKILTNKGILNNIHKKFKALKLMEIDGKKIYLFEKLKTKKNILWKL